MSAYKLFSLSVTAIDQDITRPKKDEISHTFSNLLSNNGYQTGIAGKWQLTLLRDDPHLF